MKRKRLAAMPPLRQAAIKRNWRLLQAKGCKSFLESIGLEMIAKNVYASCISKINQLWEEEKARA